MSPSPSTKRRASFEQLEIPGTPAPAPKAARSRELPHLPPIYVDPGDDLQPYDYIGKLAKGRVKFKERPHEGRGKIHAYFVWFDGDKRREVYLGSRRLSAPSEPVNGIHSENVCPRSPSEPAQPASCAQRRGRVLRRGQK